MATASIVARGKLMGQEKLLRIRFRSKNIVKVTFSDDGKLRRILGERRDR